MDLRLNVHKIDYSNSVEQLRLLIYNYIRLHPFELDVEDVHARIVLPESELKLNCVEDETDKNVKDWMLKRFLLCARPLLDPKSGLEKFVEIFQFRKKYEVAKMKLENTVPEEFYRLGFFVDQEFHDLQGNRVFIIRIKHFRKLPQFDTVIKRAMIYLIEQFDLQFEQGKFASVTLLVDVQDFDYTQTSLDLLRFCVQLGFMYAGPIHSVLVYDLPWAFTFLLRMVQSWVTLCLGFNLDIFRVVKSNNIHKYIHPNQLPTFVNGTLELNFEPPLNAIPFERMAQQLDWLEEKNSQVICDFLRKIL